MEPITSQDWRETGVRMDKKQGIKAARDKSSLPIGHMITTLDSAGDLFLVSRTTALMSK